MKKRSKLPFFGLNTTFPICQKLQTILSRSCKSEFFAKKEDPVRFWKIFQWSYQDVTKTDLVRPWKILLSVPNTIVYYMSLYLNKQWFVFK